MAIRAEILQLMEWCEAYYLGIPLVSDAVFDARCAELKKKYPDDPFWLTVGTSSRANSTKLPHKKGSLDKCNPDNVQDWIKMVLKVLKKKIVTFLTTPKIDGLSIVLQYEGGHFVRAQTRGNGYEGQDVTERFKYIVPQRIKYKQKLELDGECSCTLLNFKPYENEFALPRNFAMGTLRPAVKNTEYKKLLQKEPDLLRRLKALSFICFDANFKDIDTKYERLKEAKKLGFKTVLKPTPLSIDWGTKTKFTEKWFKQACRIAEDKIGIFCDGIVIEVNKVEYAKRLGFEANGLDPRGSRAVKLRPEDQKAEIATITNVEWNLSKRGIFVPRVNLKPVILKGAEFNWVNGISYKYVEDGEWGAGGKIKLIRSGDVIPRIMDTVKPAKLNAPKVCPHCGTKTKVLITKEKVKGKDVIKNKILICPNTNCPGVKSNKTVNYFVQLEIDDVAGATINQLYEEGFNTVKKIYNVKKSDLLGMEGFQDAKAQKVIDGLKIARRMNLALFMYCSGYFDSTKTGLGTTKLQWFIDYYGIKKILSGKINLDKMPDIPNVKEKVWELFVSGYASWYSFYKKLESIIKFTDGEKKKLSSKKLDGYIFCMTGFRDKNLVALIQDNGGIYKDSLTKATTHLFAASSSSKTQRAEKDGTKIIPAGEAWKFVEKLLKR